MNLKNEYVTGHDSYRALAKKHGLSLRQLCAMAKNEDWYGARLEYQLSQAQGSLAAVAASLLHKVHTAIEKLDAEDPDLAKIKQLSAILKDVRDLQAVKPETAATGVRVVFVGKSEEFSE